MSLHASRVVQKSTRTSRLVSRRSRAWQHISISTEAYPPCNILCNFNMENPVLGTWRGRWLTKLNLMLWSWALELESEGDISTSLYLTFPYLKLSFCRSNLLNSTFFSHPSICHITTLSVSKDEVPRHPLSCCCDWLFFCTHYLHSIDFRGHSIW